MKKLKIEITKSQADKYNLMIDALKQIRKQRKSKRQEEISQIWNLNETKILNEFINNIQEITKVALKNVKPLKY